jgi:Holliday junction resolvase RusA-like endonuclease
MSTHDNVFYLVIPGRPHGQQRHRARRMGKRVILFDAPANRVFKKKAQTCWHEAQAKARPPWDPTGPFELHVDAIYNCCKPPRKKIPHPADWRVKKHDLDNIVKAVMDGLNGLAWEDDAQVVYLAAQKWEARQGESPRTIVTVKRILDGMLPPG